MRSESTTGDHIASFVFHDQRAALVVRALFAKLHHSRVRCESGIFRLGRIELITGVTFVPLDRMTITHRLATPMARVISTRIERTIFLQVQKSI